MGGKRKQIDDDEKSIKSYELEIMSFQSQSQFSVTETATKLET